LKVWLLLISGAVSPYLFDAVLPTGAAITLAFFTLLLALKPSYRLVCLFPLAFLFTSQALDQRLEARLSDSQNKTIHELSGVIDSLPDYGNDHVRFIFLPDTKQPNIPARLRVYWHANRIKGEAASLPDLHAGEHWRLQLELRTTRGRINFHGADPEKWSFAQGIGALGYVQAGKNVRLANSNLTSLQHWRETVFEKLRSVAEEAPARRMITALAIADRRDLSGRDRDVFSATGTGHLLAISGLHIGLAAVLGFYLGRLVLLFFPYCAYIKAAVVLPWSVAWMTALGYSALSGFGVSTQRALIMLSVATLVIVSRRRIHPGLGWMIAMALVLLVDPLAPLRAGFWFSFTAVAVLLILFTPRYENMPVWRRMLLAQFGISLVMAPMGMYWFQQASPTGLLANLVAIPVVSLLAVPLILVGLIVLWLPGPIAAWLFTAAGHTLHFLFLFLQQLAAIQPDQLAATRIPGLTSTVLAMLGALLIMMPRGLPGRYVGAVLMLPMLFPMANPVARHGAQVDMLDVGQGLSVLVGSRDFLMVYDTGPGNGLEGESSWDMVDGTIHPMLISRGRVPDLVIASHADLDHAGGLSRLQDIYPKAHFLASLPVRLGNISECRTFDSWSSDGLDFEVLHPTIGLPYRGNDSSCVISVEGAGLSLLLSGDISQVIEKRLAPELTGHFRILTAPHHGSSTSSSVELINAVNPELVLISAAANNRFGFPRDDVIRRYQQANVRILNTAVCGGLRIKTRHDGSYTVTTARASRRAIWRWPAPDDCL
jgi:competence protein ComEC